MDAEDRARRRDARLLNERFKLLATFFSNLGVALFIALVVAPAANGRHLSVWVIVTGLAVAVVLHGAAQSVLNRWKSED